MESPFWLDLVYYHMESNSWLKKELCDSYCKITLAKFWRLIDCIVIINELTGNRLLALNFYDLIKVGMDKICVYIIEHGIPLIEILYAPITTCAQQCSHTFIIKR